MYIKANYVLTGHMPFSDGSCKDTPFSDGFHLLNISYLGRHSTLKSLIWLIVTWRGTLTHNYNCAVNTMQGNTLLAIINLTINMTRGNTLLMLTTRNN